MHRCAGAPGYLVITPWQACCPSCSHKGCGLSSPSATPSARMRCRGAGGDAYLRPPSIYIYAICLALSVHLSICLSVYLGAGEMHMHMHMHAHMPMMRAGVWVPAFLGAALFLGATYIHPSCLSVGLSVYLGAGGGAGGAGRANPRYVVITPCRCWGRCWWRWTSCTSRTRLS